MNKNFKILRELGVPCNALGFEYIIDALAFCQSDESYLYKITTRLYPDIAVKHNTTGSRVERAIRYAITTTFESEHTKELKEYFPKEKKPTNSDFIATIVKYQKYGGETSGSGSGIIVDTTK